MKIIFFLFIVIIAHSSVIMGQESGLYTGYISYLRKKPDSILNAFYFKAKTDEKIVALTFDDGPLANTPSIITFLKEKQIPATFFLVSRNINSNNAKMYDSDLIEVGIHTLKHDDYRTLDYWTKVQDVARCIETFTAHKLSVKYFRPAYGIVDNEIRNILKTNNIRGVLWSLDSQDWNGYRGQKIVDKIAAILKNGGIILLHDRISVTDLKNIVEVIKGKGYKIVQLSKLMSFDNEIPKLTK